MKREFRAWVRWGGGLLLAAGWWGGLVAERVPWTTSRVAGSPEPPPPARVERAYPGLKLADALDLAWEPVTRRWWVAHVNGRLASFADDPTVTQTDLALDFSRHRQPFQQLLGFTFHPGFATNRWVFVAYVDGDKKPDGTKVSRFRVKEADPPVLAADSEERILTWLGGGHNGCSLKFGPDGFLYLSSGDAESPEPPDRLRTGQNLDDLLSCILRIDVDHPDPGRAYGIPRDNPFRDRPGARPEIWAYGFRNPWRTSFGPDGALWVGEVGWELWETIHRVTAGYNGGWSRVEGPQIVHGDIVPPTPIGTPVVAHPHSEAASITGGFFYTGRALPGLAGAYVYGDFETGRLWALRAEGGRRTWLQELADTPLKIVGFAPAADGELLMLDYRPEGGVYRLVPQGGVDRGMAFPRRLSETGLFADVAAHQPAPGVAGYSVAAGRWHDGAVAERWVGVPGTGRIQVGDKWEFPAQTVFAKTLSLDLATARGPVRRPVETQLLHFDGEGWQAYSYRWNESANDADLVPAGGTNVTLRLASAGGGDREAEWRFASRSECLRCPNPWSGNVLAFNREHLASAGGRASMAGRLAALGVLASAPQPAGFGLVDPYDESAAVEARARSWLHVNCAPCHRWGAGGAVAAFFNANEPLEKMRVVDVKPTRGDFGIADARVVAPGDPARSVAWYRINTESSGHMPMIGPRRVDERGSAVVAHWIRQLGGAGGAAAKGVPPPWNDTRTALAALESLGPGSRPAPAAWVEAAANSSLAPVRDLFARFLPPGRQRPVLGESFDPMMVLGRPGEIGRGRALFQAESGPQCARCHPVGGQGRSFGPALDRVGARYSREQLLEQLVKPSAVVAPEFALHALELKDGTQLTGFLRPDGADAWWLRLESGEDRRVKRSEVESDVSTGTSAMPEGLLSGLTAAEAADLLAYLESLR
ncbi:MAG: PQQ-dependent sugar dehydrogenase [Verrucomicrobiota bacterium]